MIVAGIAIVALGVGGGLFWRAQSQNQTPQFETVTAERKTLLDSVEAPGTVVPRNRVEIIPPIGGRIEKIAVNEGDYVQNGSVLAIMSSTDRAALLDVARSEGRGKVSYWESVYKPTQLYSPLSGQVIVRNVEPGQTVNASSVVFVIADALIVKAQVDETDISKIKLGMPVLVSLDAYADQTASGSVTHISYESTIVNNVSVYDVEIQVSQVPDYFRSGMTATVKIIKDEREGVVVVPDRAIQYRQDQATLLPKSGDKSAKRNRGIRIKTGLSSNGYTEVISERVRPGDEFLVSIQKAENGPRRKQGLMNFRPQGGGNRRP